MSDPKASAPRPSSSWHLVGWGLAIFLATRVASMLLEQMSMASAVAQAVVAEWGVGRIGVTWSDPELPEPPSVTTLLRRAGAGIAVGIISAGLVISVLVSTRALQLVRGGTPSLAVLLVGLVTCALYAMRDELLLRGIALRALSDMPPSPRAQLTKVAACGLIAFAAAFGEPSMTPIGAGVQLVLGLGFGALWVRDRGAWPAWGAHTAWLFATGPLLHGGLFDSRVAATMWGGADAGPLAGAAALVAVAPLGVGALLWASRRGERELASDPTARVR